MVFVKKFGIIIFMATLCGKCFDASFGLPHSSEKDIIASVTKYLEKRQITCPGFPGYCSESNPGDTCLVVCAFGRNNVPECQSDGTWTDIPRCIEHEPGKPEQVPGICPGVPGYCSLDLPGGLCTFNCLTGPDIRSSCTSDGTWDPYPKCDGDVRETRDGCNPCPGKFGKARNRTLEGSESRKKNQNRRKNQPSTSNFAGRKKPNGNARRAQPRSNVGNPRPQKSRNRSKASRRNLAAGSNRRNSSRLPNRKNNGRKTAPTKSKVSSSNRPMSDSSGCPGGSLQSCMDACPSTSTKIFGACAGSCGRRCEERKK